MRGKPNTQIVMLPSISVEALIEGTLPESHPVRRIKKKADEVLKSISSQIDKLYPKTGRYSIPPEYLLKALLWKALFSIRSERQLVLQVQFNLLCRWFVGLPIDTDAWDASTFSKNRGELFKGRLIEISQIFFQAHLDFLRKENLLSDEHLSVDGTLLDAWASQKTFIKKSDLDENGNPPPPPAGGRNEWVDFKGKKRSNDTHISATDPDAKLASKGGKARICHELNVLSENRNNFAVGFCVKSPTGTSEREAAHEMIEKECNDGRTPSTVGGDKNYSNGDELVEQMFKLNVDAHFPARENQPNSLARLFHEEDGYATSLRKRMKIEEVMGYVKTGCCMAKLKGRGQARVIG